MRRAHWRWALILSGALATTALVGGRQAPVNPDAEILVDFTKRVKAYTDLRNKVDSGPARQKETKDPTEIVAVQKALAARIRAARVGVKQGEIFTPAIEKKFRALLRPEMKGPEGLKTKETMTDEKPVVALVVNGEYPSAEPLATVPPNVLKALPQLPEGLEYRFVRTHMILLDTRANLIVDYVLNAMQ